MQKAPPMHGELAESGSAPFKENPFLLPDRVSMKLRKFDPAD